MKQRQYSELQKEIMCVIQRLYRYVYPSASGLEEIKSIKKDYGIEEPYFTLRQYINSHGFGAYHTFHFKLNDKEISIDSIGDMLTDELCHLYKSTKEFYVVDDEIKSVGNNCENSHTDHFLILEPKED